MTTQYKSEKKTHPLKSALAMSLSAVVTAFTCVSSTGFASDIEIYQEAKSGDITLMFMLDISGSMSSGDTGVSGSRFQRVENAMKDLLQGNASKGIERISNDKIIGLATFDASTGHVRIPARRLDAVVGNSTQRQILIDFATNLPKNNSRTPTANAYADVAAYMFGTTTKGQTSSGFSSGSTTGNNKVRDSDNYVQPSSLRQAEDAKQCSGQGIYVLTDGEPNQSSITTASNLMKKALNTTVFDCNNSSLAEVDNPTYGKTGAWSCIGNFNQKLLNPTQNPAGLKIKTAVIGFGSNFNSLPNYDRTLNQETNLRNINNASVNSTIANDIKNAARWGVLGEGGWYSGNSSEDIVNSVNNFINDLGSDIPAVTTGTPTIPVDALNPTVLQNKAYYPQFEPTPDKSYQLWAGNLKKYNVDTLGMLRDKSNNLIADRQGRIINNYDLWSPALTTTPTDVERSEALVGGVKMKLDLRHASNNTAKRKLLTTRDYSVSSRETNALRQVSINDLDHATRKEDPKIGYVMNLLGYSFDPKQYLTTGDNPRNNLTKTQLLSQPEFRQVGAVMHSSPVLVTNKGKITYDYTTKEIGSEGREDYILFGTTQGLLHVVDAVTGQEKFAFLPNEMVESQAEAFNKPEITNGGINKLFYGVDGPWTAYSEYVTDKDDSDTLTVGEGKSYSFTLSTPQGQQQVNRTQKGKQLVYGGLRMGGKSYYALDLLNIDNPVLKFKIQPSGVCSSANPLGCMGQSWSKPTIGSVNWNGQKRLVMFVGGGYDAEGTNTGNANHKTTDTYRGYEYDDYVQSNKIGAGVYMFDALTGQLLWWAGANTTNDTTTPTYAPSTGPASSYAADMKYSVVSQIRALDRDADGLIDHLYFGDLGGQAWRIDINNDADTQKNIFARTPTRILNLNNGAYSPRFYEMPAFSTYSLGGEIFAAVSFGSGNRSKPLAEYTVSATDYDYDAIFNIYDKDVANNQLLKLTGTGNSKSFTMENDELLTRDVALQAENNQVVNSSSSDKLISLDDTNRFTRTQTRAPFATTSGWYYKFKSFKVQSEKVMAIPIVIGGDMFVTTFDGSKPGLSGDCGAGVKGESFMTMFCMPYGQCNSGSATTYRLNLGAGIVGGAVGAGDSAGRQRLIVTNVDTTNITGNKIVDSLYVPRDELVPQVWYDRR